VKIMVILPTYNEAGNLPNMVAELLSLHLDHIEVLIIDDNSPDGTGAIADKLQARHPKAVHVIHRPGKMGLGTAYIAGFDYALAQGADRVVQMDADFSHSPSVIPVMLDLIAREGYDVVIGSRYVVGGQLDEKWGPSRRFLSKLGNVYAKWVTGMPIQDATAGFKCFKADCLRGLPLSKIVSSGYAFQIEMNYACYKAGYRIHETPITFEDRVLGSSKMSSRIILEAMWRVWQMRWRY
jgi:dolichol-phosphate mannosyltransferase